MAFIRDACFPAAASQCRETGRQAGKACWILLSPRPLSSGSEAQTGTWALRAEIKRLVPAPSGRFCSLCSRSVKNMWLGNNEEEQIQFLFSNRVVGEKAFDDFRLISGRIKTFVQSHVNVSLVHFLLCCTNNNRLLASSEGAANVWFWTANLKAFIKHSTEKLIIVLVFFSVLDCWSMIFLSVCVCFFTCSSWCLWTSPTSTIPVLLIKTLFLLLNWSVNEYTHILSHEKQN